MSQGTDVKMAGSEQDDPFTWSVDRLANEFGSQRLFSLLTPGRNLPDLEKLASTIRDQEFDGPTLLTYEEMCGRESLWQDLAIKKPPHKATINELIRHLQKHSPKYAAWKAAYHDSSQPTSHQEQSPIVGEKALNGVDNGPSNSINGIDMPQTSDEGPAAAAIPNGAEERTPGRTTPRLTPPADVDITLVVSPTHSSALDVVLDIPENSPRDPDGPPAKKRKIAPMVVSSATVRQQPDFIATEADAILSGTADAILKKMSGSSGYLGPHALQPDSITKPVFDPLEDNDDREFGWVNRRPFLPGRAVQVSQKMKRLLRAGPFAMVSGEVEAEDDPALPVFGDSDDEMDSVTWEEIQQEERERAEEQERLKNSGNLSEEQVREVIQKTIDSLKAEWTEKKKPQKDRKAWGVWRKCRRENTCHSTIHKTQKWLKNLEKRIEDLTAEIIKTRWNGSDGLEAKASSYLDPTIADYMESQWLVDLLKSPIPPPKPSALPKLKPQAKKAPVDLGEDEEILTDEDDFVVEDDGFDPDPDPDPMDIDPGDFSDDQVSADNQLLADQQAVADGTPQRDVAEVSEAPTQQVIKSEETAFGTPRKTRATDIISIPSTPVKQLDKVPDLTNLEAVAQIGAEHWTKVNDRERLIATILFDKPPTWRLAIFKLINEHGSQDLWENILEPALTAAHAASLQGKPIKIEPNIFELAKLFNAFISILHTRMDKDEKSLNSVTWQKTMHNGAQFSEFCNLVKMIMKILAMKGSATRNVDIETEEMDVDTQTEEIDGDAVTKEVDGDAADTGDEEMDSHSDSSDNVMTFKKKKRRDKTARSLQDNTKLQTLEFEKRAKLLRARLAQTGYVPSDKSRLIVNETKESDDQALIYIPESIGGKIKDHQIDGVRFLWNTIVASQAVSGGGLLAHAMGLGKTMQVITLLVVIAESARSPDPSVYSQIPEGIRDSKTLILCPPGLLENWIDEILTWAPENLLGELFMLGANVAPEERSPMVAKWASGGGLLVMSLDLFTSCVFNNEDEEMTTLLLETPSIVVCDEAHLLKNPNSQRHKASRGFTTKNRIALTGSPLTRGIEDYYYMIDWVSPGYLSDHAEFTQRFETPIKEGLFADSEPAARRKARKQLHVLKGLVEPIVHRRDTDVLRAELPQKWEFIITVPLTEIQKRAYDAYIDACDGPWGANFSGQSGIWSLVASLTRLLAHPYIFKVKLENAKKDKTAKTIKTAKSDTNVEDSLPERNRSEIMTTLADRRIEDLENSNKIRVLVKILDECKRVGDKVLIFSQSIDTLNYVESICQRQQRSFQRLDGATKISDRQNAIKKFNSNQSIEIYLISTKAGGIGFNMCGANRVVLFDFKYTPAEEKQAIGRAYRIGQVKPVFVYYLTVGGTYEDSVRNTTVFKSQLASRIVDKKNPDPRASKLKDVVRRRPTIPDIQDVSHARNLDPVLDAVLDEFAKPDDEEKCIVRAVTRTEAFEEEEKFELTPEDKLEAEKDIESERLRISNPEEYKRREQEKSEKLRAGTTPTLPEPGSLPPSSLGRESSSVPPPPPHLRDVLASAPVYTNRLIKIQVPEHMRDQRHRVFSNSASRLDGSSVTGVAAGSGPLGEAGAHTANENGVAGILPNMRPVNTPRSATPASTQAQRTKSLGSLVSPDRVFGSKTPAATQGASPSPRLDFHRIMPPPGNQGLPATTPPADSDTKPLDPILGKHTRYKESSTEPSKPPSSQLPRPLSVPDEKEAQLLRSLTRRAEQVRQEGYKPLLEPKDLVHSVNKGFRKRNLTGLPRLDKLQNWIKYIQENPRFADGLLSGHLPVRNMIDMDRARLEQTSTDYHSMSESDFKATVWKGQPAADVGYTIQQSPEDQSVN
ncbi:hypothetical protein V8F20_008488 [Naviculisporaceae sp. PSN 640]